MKKGGMTSAEARQQIRETETRMRLREERAFRSVLPWHELTKDDYDFRSWAVRRAKTERLRERLHAGCMYEYARESRELRGLLALMNPKRERPEWERGQSFVSFQGLHQEDAEKVLGGWLYCLADLADYLTHNISFAELYLTKRAELERAFGGMDKQMRSDNGEPLPFLWNVWRSNLSQLRVSAVSVASESERHLATVRQSGRRTESGKRTRRLIEKYGHPSCGSEVIALRIRWGQFTDKEIAEQMRYFAKRWRPKCKRCHEPEKRKGVIRKDRLLSWLDALSAMRLASYYSKRSPSKSLGDGRYGETAIECFSRVRLCRVRSAKRKSPQDVSETHFSTHTAEARSVFAETFSFLQSFPQGGQPDNTLTWSQRKRSTRIKISNPR